MKTRVQSWLSLGALALLLVGISLSAQQTPQSSAPDPQNQAAPPPNTQNQQPPASQSQTPDTQNQQQDQQQPPAQQQQAQPDQSAPPDRQAHSSAEGQSFTGTIVKSGNKYVFQDAATGNTYDIDHQDEVQKFEGKKVKVHGTLDESRKMIHIQ